MSSARRAPEYVVVSSHRTEDWDVRVYGPSPRSEAERFANLELKAHPKRIVGVHPIRKWRPT